MPVSSARRPYRRLEAALLASVSVAALMMVPTQGAKARPLLGGANVSSAVTSAMDAAMAGVQQAQQATQQSRNSLAAAVRAIQTMQAIQAATRNAAAAAGSSVPNGLTPGGLVVAPSAANDPAVWQGASLPTQSVSGGQTTVTVQQTAPKSILTWSSFNVGANTLLYFNQSAGTQTSGNNNWIALNRVIDPSGVPSQILGQIKAEGSVYLINANGIIFGGTSQVDVHTLVASSLGFLGENLTGLTPGSAAYDAIVTGTTKNPGPNAQFLNSVSGGIAAPEATGSGGSSGSGGNLVLGLGTQLTGSAASSYVKPGNITIQAGASISTHANGTGSDGGFVLIAAPNVSNAGTITTADGQTILAAGIGVSLTPNPASTQFLLPELTGRISVNGVDVTPVGSLVNTGLVQAPTGNVTLLGSNVTLAGVVGVTTSVSVPGSIVISTVDEADIGDTGPGVPADRRIGALIVSGTIANLPEENGQSVPSDGGSFTAGSINLTGGSVWLQIGSLIEAPGASVGITALTPTRVVAAPPPGDTQVQGRIYIDSGATVDVAGLANVELPVSATLVTIPLSGPNELANSPLLRNSFLNGLKNVVIDSTLSGTNADGLAWVGSPILNASGYVGLIPRSIDQLLTNGGSITLSGGQVMTAAGSSLNLDGGFVHYLGGMVNTTRLVNAYGRLVSIGNADPNVPIIGVAGQFTVDHSHWNVTDVYQNPLMSDGHYEPDYIVGGNAGTLSVFGSQATVLDGAMSAQAFAGIKQTEAGLAPSGTSPGGNFLPQGGSFILGAASAQTFPADTDNYSGQPGSVIIQNSAPELGNLSPGFGAATPLNTAALNALGPNDPDNILAWTTVPAVPISNGGFANLTVTTDTTFGRALMVAQGTTLSVQPGGSITLAGNGGNPTTVLGHLIAPAGRISVSGGDNIIVGPDAVISAAGLWVNDSGQPGAAGATNFINGGSISLATTGGSILLSPGSVIDVSSGGAMLYNGQLAANSGIPLGKGGSVSLKTGQFYSSAGVSFAIVGGPIDMEGTIESWGFSGGGTLTLQAAGFQIGGDPATAPNGALYLPADFSENQGLGSYVLNAMYDATVAPGTTVRLTQQNLIPNLTALAQTPSGANLNAGGLTTLGTLDPYHRQATNLVITAGGALYGGSPAPVPGVTDTVTIGEGASIVADAGAHIGLGSPAQITVLGSIIAPGGSIILSADDQNSYGFLQPGLPTTGINYKSASKSIWLGSNAVLDVSGVALIDPFAAPVRLGNAIATPVTGKVLDGGSVLLSDDSGYVVAQAGSVIDVAGASSSFDLPQSSPSVGFGGGQSYSAQPVWSNAGSITLATAVGLNFDGTIQAQAGAPQGQGGTLTILPEVEQSNSTLPSATALILQQSGYLVPSGSTPGNFPTPPGVPAGTLIFAVDRLNGSGIGTLVLGGGSQRQGGEFFDTTPVPIAFAGNVDLSLSNAFIATTAQIIALKAGATSIPALAAGTSSIGAPTVSISAPYVEITGPIYSSTAPQFVATAALGDGVLNVNASFIDLENQVALARFGRANFTSSGDIRLSSTDAADTTSLQPGAFYTPGNLTFKAADLYPSSGSAFIIDAKGPAPTTITFLGNGASTVPLSAGGTLLIDATNIVQSGTIRAPSGTIVLGVGDKTNATTQTLFANLPITNTTSVALNAGSVTSVSLDGAIVPYGITIDGTEWQYNAVASDTTPVDLTAPPAKVITINGANVSLNSGATIDLSGGGDLQAIEWVPGTGGSRNVLSQYNLTYPASGAPIATPLYPDARDVYAIIPGVQSPVAAYDPVYAQTTQPATEANGTASSQTLVSGVGQAALGSAVGQAVYLSGMPGLPAGVYTLLPAQYATLPGAYRVVQNTGASNVVPGQSVTLPDGTSQVSGYYVNALNGARSSTVSQFEVQSTAVWGQYSQYTLTSANSFFPTLAANAGTVTPPLPMDAGRLAIAATGAATAMLNPLTLGATLNTAAAAGGVGAQIDIAAQDIQIVGAGETALSGYLQLSASSLDALGAGSLLIGGTRTSTTSGVTIDAIANSVVVSNDAAAPLTGPEIILVTKTASTAIDRNAANGLRVDSGSVITASGAYSAASDQPITIGSSTVSGDGALLMVTNGALVSITRSNLPPTSLASLTVGAGAVLTGGQALVLDSSGGLRFDPAASFSGASIAVDASAITLTNEMGTAAAALPGFVIGPSGLAQFANSQQIDLRSYGAIGFVGNVVLNFGGAADLSAGTFTSDGGTVSLTAATIAFTNDLGAPVGTPAAGAGILTVTATQIDLGAGAKALSGFGSVVMTAGGGIVGQGTGSFDMGAANVTLAAPVYLADTSSQTSLTTTGTLNLNANPNTALALTPVGGAISFIGGTVNDKGANIQAPAGNVSLEATSGDLTIASGALISSAGVSKQFFDVTEYASAGNITLIADQGSINVQAGATLDFSGATNSQGNLIGGAAGSLTLSAPQQVVNLSGTLQGGAAAGYLGGSFSLNTGGAVNLDNLAVELASSGVNNMIEVQTGAGNLVLSASNTLTAHSVLLVADVANGASAVTSTSSNTIGTGLQTFTVQTGLGGVSAGEAITFAYTDGKSMTGTVTSYNPATGVLVVNVTITSGSGTYSSWSTGSGWTTGGNIILNGTINASGSAGGSIGLYGKSGVDLEGSLIATGSSATRQGGTVEIGTVGIPNTVGGVVQIDPNYGYEQVSAANSGVITVGANALIDVSGGTAGGTVNFRAPLLDNLNNGGVNIAIAPTAVISRSRSTTLEAFAVWSTTDPLTNGAAQHFDGIVDPAGWYADAVAGAGQPGMVAGAWTDQNGNPLPNPTAAQLATYLANDYFTPTTANTDHQTFYGYVNGDPTQGAGTLMGFVENFPISSTVTSQFNSIANFSVTPGIELDNPTPATGASSINNGNISILTNWNLGAGSSPTNLAYRFQGQAPTITFRAENNVEVDASLSDGFFQIANPTAPPLKIVTINPPAPSNYNSTHLEYIGVAYYNQNYFNNFIKPPTSQAVMGAMQPVVPGQQSQEIAQYYGLYKEYLDYLTIDTAANGLNEGLFIVLNKGAGGGGFNAPIAPGQPTFTESAPTSATASPAAYQSYLQDYETYIAALYQFSIGRGAPQVFNIVPLQPPPAVLTALIQPSTVTTGTIPTDNTPSPVSTPTNGFPLLSASLNAGASSSYRIVAGADFSSADPLALLPISTFASTDGGVTLNGHFSYVDTNGQTINAPTMIRTGAGSIDIAAANNISLLDPTAPGVIYTAGAPVVGAPVSVNEAIAAGNGFGAYDLLVTNIVNPDGGGNISIQAGNDINGFENTTGTGSALSQFWWQWMQVTAAPTVNTVNGTTTITPITQTSIDFGAFDQGVMSVGGNVTVSAGRNITNLAVSLPTTWYLSNNNTVVNTVGGGNLTVTAGGNILSGDYFVAQGTGTITAGGRIGSSGLTQVLNAFSGTTGEVSTIFATQNGVLNVSARQGVDIGAVVNPSYLQGTTLVDGYHMQADAQSYSAASALNVLSSTGNVSLYTLADRTLIGAGSPGVPGGLNDDSYVLPATVTLTAFTGGITIVKAGELYPSATGQLSLIADQSISIYNTNSGGSTIDGFGLIDAVANQTAASALPSPLNEMPLSLVGVTNQFNGSLTSNALIDHSQTPLHAGDTQPVLIYSLTGSITDGVLESSGVYGDLLQVSVDKPAQIQAGQDILNLAFLGQNLRGDDVTSIIAGRDILDSRNFAINLNFIAPSLLLGGPGTFNIEAGRNIGPLLSQAQIYAVENSEYNNPVTGIDAIGNADNPYLPHQSANVQTLFGVGPGIDNAGFVANYIAPGASIPGINTTADLIAFMKQYDEGLGIDTGLVKDKPVVTLTGAQAWAQFQMLPVPVQQLFSEQILFKVLTTVGQDYHDPNSPFFNQYARGYQAINTLFPASDGYTANSLNGGANGANTLVSTGNLDIRSTTIQTQQGGNVTILGPGGQALVGSTDAPPVITFPNGKVAVGPGAVGILTLEQGNVNIFTDQSLLLAQSRVFTEQGGNMVIWSSNGDINAGKGAKTIADVPPPQYVSDDDHYNTVDARGEVAGAGIATLQTIPDSPPGSIFLIAPRGTVDAGAAGIRVSGNLVIAALQVLNANNIQVQGTSIGVPTPPTANVGALTTANNQTGAAQAVPPAQGNNDTQPSVIIVEFLGFGGGDAQPDSPSDKKRPSDGQRSYNTNSAVQYVGAGNLSDDEKRRLIEGN